MIRLGLVIGVAGALFTEPARAQCLAERPTEAGAPYSYDGAPASSIGSAGGAVRVWRAEAGPHAATLEAAETIAEIADHALASFAAMGLPAPLNDGSDVGCSTNGGDARLDVYLFDFASSADGTIVLERCSGAACGGFALIENDFAGRSYPSHEIAARTVTPHELFHLVQAAISADLDAWWSEGTAQWATETLYPELDDFERHLSAFLSNPTRALDAPASGAASGFLYGTALFPKFLAERHDPDIVVEALLASMEHAKTTDAIDAALGGRESSLGDAYAEFASWNVATGSRAGATGYAEASRYPEVPLVPLASELSALTTSLSAHYFHSPAQSSVRRIAITTDAGRNRSVAIPLRDGIARLDELSELPFEGSEELIVVVAGITTIKSDAPFTLHSAVLSNPTGPPPPPSDASPPRDGGCAVSGRAPSISWMFWFLALACLRRFVKKGIPTMTLSSAEIRTRFDAHRAEHPRAFHRDVAHALGISEYELVAASAGVTATPLEPRWDELFAALPEIGRVKTITRNDACVLEKWGTFGPLERFGRMAQTLGEMDLRIFFDHWASLFAVEQAGTRGTRRSLQIFDRHGDSVQKIYVEPEGDVARYHALIARLSPPNAPELATPVLATRATERPDSEIDVEALRAAWDALRDTHDFFGLLRRFGVNRTQALRLAGSERAEPVRPDITERVLTSAAASELPIMIFVGSRGAIQIHSGPIRKVSRSHGYLNVLDPTLNLHLREELVHAAWLVRKPTADGIVTSLELYDESGETILLLFGLRKPGKAENPAWRALLDSIRA